jgi:hypothetical protein
MSISRRGLIVGLAGSAALAGCAGVKLVEAGEYRAGRAFGVTLNRPWSDMSAMLLPRPEGVQLLTIDGPALNQLYLAVIQPGGSFVRPADEDTPRPLYRADMGDTEMVEFVIDSLAVNYQEPQSAALRPQQLAGAPGVRFDIAARTQAGLNMSGTALVARSGDNLNMLMFLAPSEHYYRAFQTDVDAIFASAHAV